MTSSAKIWVWSTVIQNNNNKLVSFCDHDDRTKIVTSRLILSLESSLGLPCSGPHTPPSYIPWSQWSLLDHTPPPAGQTWHNPILMLMNQVTGGVRPSRMVMALSCPDQANANWFLTYSYLQTYSYWFGFLTATHFPIEPETRDGGPWRRYLDFDPDRNI